MMSYQIKTHNVTTYRGSLKIMKSIADKFIDNKTGVDFFKKIMGGKTLEWVFLNVRKRYQREDPHEIFMRPDLFWEMGGDCDDQAIFLSSFFIFCGIERRLLYYNLAGQQEITHVFVTVKNGNRFLSFDCLPRKKMDENVKYNILKSYNYESL